MQGAIFCFIKKLVRNEISILGWHPTPRECRCPPSNHQSEILTEVDDVNGSGIGSNTCVLSLPKGVLSVVVVGGLCFQVWIETVYEKIKIL